jgi:hypothetical protein
MKDLFGWVDSLHRKPILHFPKSPYSQMPEQYLKEATTVSLHNNFNSLLINNQATLYKLSYWQRRWFNPKDSVG